MIENLRWQIEMGEQEEHRKAVHKLPIRRYGGGGLCARVCARVYV